MMSAEPYEFKWSLIKAISRRIINEVDGIARVVYDTTSKPPGGWTYSLLGAFSY
jgi:GMP synthase (glutamine-hydrolysing)